MNVKRVICTVVSVVALVVGSVAHAIDPFHTRRDIPTNPAAALLDDHIGCAFGSVSSVLTLAEAIERALCSNPDTRNAWVAIEQQAASVGVSKSAYLPTLSASGQQVHEDAITRVRDEPSLSSDYGSAVHTGELSLSWILYDFGGRRATLENAKALLRAAQANDDAVLQQTFATAAKNYYVAVAAREQVRADDAIVADANDSLTAAKERSNRGVVPITDLYQAQTAYEQAQIAKTKDEGQELAYRGTLANSMAVPPDTSFALEDLDDTGVSGSTFQDNVSELIAQAERNHPAILAAEQNLAAAKAGVTEAKAKGRPTISVVAKYTVDNEPVQLGLGLPHYQATGHDGYVGFQVTVPLFSGFETTYQVRQAEAQVDQQAVALDKARQQVALDVWSSYQTLRTDSENLSRSAELLSVATKAWESAQRRYRSGVGTILELLGTQTSLAQARAQRVNVLTAWRSDRLALASALGRLDWNDIEASNSRPSTNK